MIYAWHHDGRASIDIAREFKPDIILLDMGLPHMNGYEVCSLMRQEPSLKDTVFIAQTGMGPAGTS
jgi:CheY-like chemotaxis protein